MIQVRNNTKHSIQFPPYGTHPGFVLTPGQFHELPEIRGEAQGGEGELEKWFDGLEKAPKGVQQSIARMRKARDPGERFPQLEVVKLAEGTPKSEEGMPDPDSLEDRPESQAIALISYVDSKTALRRYAKDRRPDVAAAAKSRLKEL